MLNQKFEFTIDDLQMNQKGVLSEEQKYTNLREETTYVIVSIVIFSLILTIATFYAGVKGGISFGIIISLMCIYILLNFSYKAKKILAEKRDFTYSLSRAKVKKLEKVHKSQINKISENPIPLFQLFINDVRIHFDQERYNQFAENKLYTFYYWFYDSERYNKEKLCYVLSVEEHSENN